MYIIQFIQLYSIALAITAIVVSISDAPDIASELASKHTAVLASNFVLTHGQKGESFTSFFTAKIGLQTSGVVHSGVAELDVGQQIASFTVTAKLAFVKKHQDKLFHKLSVYNHLAPKDTKSIPPVWGIFAMAETMVLIVLLHDAGLSIRDGTVVQVFPKVCSTV
ncbi:hypothetical protein PILCRDRAFT_9097 [Piloderma croceum F 1598]|uniref:Uncharacterized protein n=1 Tax=Piloderma croceum (strain F 1598) TaxID=765440 RepID=A0A0C3BUP0_PILCF|nr:hypothetical protein PILCRDRAFT_9097 [Piloderma croceum F 1598]